MIDDTFLNQLTQTIAHRFHPRRIILFGSRARGHARTDSDVDLFVEMETSKPPPERAIEISSLFGLRAWSLDVVVYTSEEVAKLRGVHGTLLAAVEAEGKLLYERPQVELSRVGGGSRK